MYHNSNVVVAGGSSTYVARDSIHNHGDSIVHNHATPAFERLEKHVAANALHNSGEVSDQPKCHPGTRVAILDHIIAWATALAYTYPIVWLHGPAGAGKSAILRTIAQILFNQHFLLASFFFFRTSADRNSSDKFISTIAYQVALSIPATRLHIEQAIERNPLMFSLSLWDQAHALIVSPMLAVLNDPSFDASQYPRIIIVDGLDECDNRHKQCEILQVLCRVLRNLPVPIAVLVASRPEHHIRDAFGLDDLNVSSSRLFLDNSYDPDADIKKYFTDRFSTIRAKHPLSSYLPTSWPSQEVVDQLVAKASGQFIYASTVDKFISSPRHNPVKRLDIILGALDAGMSKPFEQLDILYSVILSTIDPVDLAGTLRILGVLLVPLSVTRGAYSPAFLEWLLELETGDVRCLLFDLESLLTIGHRHENVHFFHASLSDYLFDKSRSGQFWIDAGMAYADLAQQLLVQLSKSKSRGLEDSLDTNVSSILFGTKDLYSNWGDSRGFLRENVLRIFSRATPTPDLHKAIQNFDLTMDPDPDMSIHCSLLEAIRESKFSDATKLHRTQFARYVRIIDPKIQVYFQDVHINYCFVTSAVCFFDPYLHRGNMMRIFHLSPEMVVREREHGFGFLSSTVSVSIKMALDGVLHDPRGKYFNGGNHFANIASYLTKCMTEDSRLYVPPGCLPSKGHKDEVTAVEATMAKIFPRILSKSSIRRDLTENIKKHSLSRAYLEYNEIGDAITKYISRSEAYNNSSREMLKSKPRPSGSKPPSIPNQPLKLRGNTSEMVPHGVRINKPRDKSGQTLPELKSKTSSIVDKALERRGNTMDTDKACKKSGHISQESATQPSGLKTSFILNQAPETRGNSSAMVPPGVSANEAHKKSRQVSPKAESSGSKSSNGILRSAGTSTSNRPRWI